MLSYNMDGYAWLWVRVVMNGYAWLTIKTIGNIIIIDNPQFITWITS